MQELVTRLCENVSNETEKGFIRKASLDYTNKDIHIEDFVSRLCTVVTFDVLDACIALGRSGDLLAFNEDNSVVVDLGQNSSQTKTRTDAADKKYYFL